MILLELVPKNQDDLVSEAEYALSKFPINGINVPDILRFSLRSTDAIKPLLINNQLAVPHIRSIDRSIEDTLILIKGLIELGLKKVLIVTGDPPEENRNACFDVSPIDIIKNCKQHFPSLEVFAAVDPYRNNFETEIAYAKKKLNVGAAGLFSQPFFDIDLAKTYLDTFKDTHFFLGISPVVTENSKRYWETRNNVQFPETFQLDLEYNCKLTKELINLSKSYKQHNYLMPIRVPLADYLKGVFERNTNA